MKLHGRSTWSAVWYYGIGWMLLVVMAVGWGVGMTHFSATASPPTQTMTTVAPVAVGAEVAKTITFEVPDTDFADIVEGLFYVHQREVDESGKNIHTDEDAVHNWLRLVLESTANRGLEKKAKDQSVAKSVSGTVKRHDE